MARAIKLAEKGRYTTCPNPNVGCVIVNEGEIVGEGFHIKAGTPHAEVHALAMAGERAKGATCYVTLEPCSHYGRTPPCASALIEAGVAKVVAAMVDPFPQVAGRGLQMLAMAGIDTASGLLEQEARALNPGFLTRVEKGRPFVRLKLASSLDGRTAMASGESQWITGADARRDVQKYRAESSLILSGADTVLMDNASLNVRAEELDVADYPGEIRQPVRLVIDGQNRVDGPLKLFEQPTPVWLARTAPDAKASLPPHVSQLMVAENAQGKVDLPELFKVLAKQDINTVWVEAGPQLAGALLSQQLVDEVILYQAPKLMGDEARGLFHLPGLEKLANAITLEWQDVRRVGGDLKITARVQACLPE